VKPIVEGALYSRALGRVVLYPLASWGYRRFVSTGSTPSPAYRAMRKLYGNADTGLFVRLVDASKANHGMTATAARDGETNGIAAGAIDAVLAQLHEDGFAVLDRLLPTDLCDDLEVVARAAECALIGREGRLPGRQRFDEANPVAIRYDIDEGDVLGSRAAQLLIADASLFAIAEGYLGATPVQDLVAMWWSAAAGSRSTSTTARAAAAQQFHFDLDRLRFLKVFVFLTDVNERTGPHVYVRGSHRGLPRHLRRDGRHGDDEVLAALGHDVRMITGPRGTVFLADTIGLHKGKNLETGHRLVFQTEYATSLFGAPYGTPTVRAPIPEFAAMRERHPASFARFRST